MATSCCVRFGRRMVHFLFAILVVVFVGCYVFARYAGECDMDCDEDVQGAVDDGEGIYKCGDKTSCGRPTLIGVYASAAAICLTALLWIMWTIRSCMIARKERREALDAVGGSSTTFLGKQDSTVPEMKAGNLVAAAGGDDAV